MTAPVNEADWLLLTGQVLPLPDAIEWVSGAGWGAVASFFGVVRDNAEGRTGVTAIDYEAYEDHVVPRFADLASRARRQWPELGRIVIWHRVGLVALGEVSVAIVVSAPHRGESLDACRYLIDALKATVPIWKLEHWPGGVEWSPAAHGIEPALGDKEGER